jgi:uncharacterized membrane protein (DUF2068 family)
VREVSSKTRGGSAVGVRIIVLYKFLRGILSILLALVFGAAVLGGGADHLRALAEILRQHVMGAWSLRLADLLVRVSTHRHLVIATAALAADGSFVLFEGWALGRRFRWAPWLIVAATASFVPWEAYELYRRVRVGRVLVLLVNVAVVVYLFWRERRSGEDTSL